VGVRLEQVRKGLEAAKRFLDPPLGPDAPPVEVRAAVVDSIERKITILGLGRLAFPYDTVAVRIAVPPGGDKAALEKAFADLDGKVRERFRERRCEVPPALAINVSMLKKAPADWEPNRWFSIDCRARGDAAPRSASSSSPVLKVTVVKGLATRRSYAFSDTTILIGRTAEVVDRSGRIRANHLAVEDRSSTVSRAHARFRYDKAHGAYRLLDEGSARGTRLVRGGTTICVPHDPRGVRIQSGDEIHFGDAVVRVTLE